MNIRTSLDYEEIYGTSGFTAVLNSVQDLHQFENEIGENSSTISEKQKFVMSAINLYSQVFNGGFIQYFYNGYGKQFPVFLNGLVKYDAPIDIVEIIKKVDSIFETYKSKFIRESEDPFVEILNLYHSEDQNMNELSSLDTDFYKSEKHFFKYFEKFIRSNLHDFIAPKDGVFVDNMGLGFVKTYYPNGNIKDSFKTVDGLITDVYECYYSNGNFKKRVFYDSGGNNTGLYEHYFENGHLNETKLKGTYDDSCVMSFYHNNGVKRLEWEVYNHQYLLLNGWDDTGVQILKDGTGIFIKYFETNGSTTKYIKDFNNFLLDGKSYTYHNDVISLYQEMKKGEEHGKTIIYDKGKPIQEIIYIEGVEISRMDHD